MCKASNVTCVSSLYIHLPSLKILNFILLRSFEILALFFRNEKVTEKLLSGTSTVSRNSLLYWVSFIRSEM